MSDMTDHPSGEYEEHTAGQLAFEAFCAGWIGYDWADVNAERRERWERAATVVAPTLLAERDEARAEAERLKANKVHTDVLMNRACDVLAEMHTARKTAEAALAQEKARADEARQDALNAAWRAVDALGGTRPNATTEYHAGWDDGYSRTLNDACEAIEKLGGKDPDPDVSELRRQFAAALARADEAAMALAEIVALRVEKRTPGESVGAIVDRWGSKLIEAQRIALSALSSAKGAGE